MDWPQISALTHPQIITFIDKYTLSIPMPVIIISDFHGYIMQYYSKFTPYNQLFTYHFLYSMVVFSLISELEWMQWQLRTMYVHRNNSSWFSHCIALCFSSNKIQVSRPLFITQCVKLFQFDWMMFSYSLIHYPAFRTCNCPDQGRANCIP